MRTALTVVVLVCACAARADDRDPIKEKLFAAKVAYDKEMSAYRTAVGEWFDKREDAARKAGDKKAVDTVKAERKAFDEGGTLPKTAPASVQQKPAQVRKALETAYAEAVKAYTKEKKDDRAAAVEKEWKALLDENTINLLALVNPKSHVLAGDWKRSGNALVGTTPGDAHSRLQLPYEPGEEYELELTCRRVEGGEWLGLGLVAGGRKVFVFIDGWPTRGYESGFEFVDNKQLITAKGQLIEGERDHVLTCSVRTGKIDVSFNEKATASFKGDFTRLTLHESYRTPNEKALFLAVGPKTSFQIDRIVVRPIKGKGTILK